MLYTDPKDPLNREFKPANKVEETRFKAMGYKPVAEKKAEEPKLNKAEEPKPNKASSSRSHK